MSLKVASLSDVYLYTVDDLRDVVEENVRLRSHEANKADKIVEGALLRLKHHGTCVRLPMWCVTISESAMAIQQVELERAPERPKREISGRGSYSPFA